MRSASNRWDLGIHVWNLLLRFGDLVGYEDQTSRVGGWAHKGCSRHYPSRPRPTGATSLGPTRTLQNYTTIHYIPPQLRTQRALPRPQTVATKLSYPSLLANNSPLNEHCSQIEFDLRLNKDTTSLPDDLTCWMKSPDLYSDRKNSQQIEPKVKFENLPHLRFVFLFL